MSHPASTRPVLFSSASRNQDRNRAERPGPDFRAPIHNEDSRHGNGAVDLPVDYCRSRRAAYGVVFGRPRMRIPNRIADPNIGCRPRILLDCGLSKPSLCNPIYRCGVIESGPFGCFGWRGAEFLLRCRLFSACTGGAAVPAAGAAASCVGAAGRSLRRGPAPRAAAVRGS